MNALGGLRLVVRKEDAARAREILAPPEGVASSHDLSEPSECPLDSCPSCGCPGTVAVETRRKVGHLLWLLTGFPWVRPGSKRKCANCGRTVLAD